MDVSRCAQPVPLTPFCFQAMSLFRQEPNVTLMTWGRRGSEDFLVAWDLIQRHKIPCDWLSLTESLKENYKYTAVIKYLSSFWERKNRKVSHWRHTCSVFQTIPLILLFFLFFFYRNVSKVKRLFIGGATSLDTRWCHKSRKAWKSKTSIWTKRGKQ